MLGKVCLYSLLAAILSLPNVAQGQDFNEVGLDCWEVCFFEASDQPEDQSAVEFFYTLVEKIRFMRMYYGVNATALLMDSSIHKKHFEVLLQHSNFQQA